MKTKMAKSILALALAFVLVACAAPVSAASIQYAPPKYAPQQGLTVTFYHLAEAESVPPTQLLDESRLSTLYIDQVDEDKPPEYVPTVIKTCTWTPGMQFDQGTVEYFGLDELSWAGMTQGTWVEISGWVRMWPGTVIYAQNDPNTLVKVFVNGECKLDRWDFELNVSDLVTNSVGQYRMPAKFTICLSPKSMDENSSDPYYWPVDCRLNQWAPGMPYDAREVVPSDLLYPRFPVDAFGNAVTVSDDNDIVSIDSWILPGSLHLSDYEFGIAGGTFETLHMGDNCIAPRSGQYVVRAKAEPEAMYVLGTLSVKPPAGLKILRRTPTTATLTWTPTPQSGYSPMPPVTFEVYRKIVGWDASFGKGVTTVSTLPGGDYVGSTFEATGTDEGLLYDAVYEYFVRAVYPGGYGDSVTVRTDSVDMEGLLSPPRDLAVVSNDGREVVFQWTPVGGAKGYQVLREDISTPSGWTKYGTYAIGKTSTAAFKETKATGMEQQATYRYYVQALDAAGIPSRLSVPIEVVIKDTTPPSAPGNFAIEGGLERVLLGPTRQVSMSWEPSTDNVGVVGYDILRSAVGWDGTLPGDEGLWQEPVHKVGSTVGTTYTDAGLEPGACYTYYVAARDAAGNTSQSKAFVIVHCPYLSGLAAKGDGKAIELMPQFQYNHGEYVGVVDNATKTLTLNARKIDPKATVLVNGQEIPDGKAAGPYPLEIGENRFEVEVISRPTSVFWGEARMTYTVTVTRANLAPLPVLTVPAASAPIPEGGSYQASGSITAVETNPWLGTVDYGDGSVSEALILKEDGTFDLLHTYADNGEYEVTVAFRYLDLGLVTATVPVTVTNVPPAIAVGSGAQEYTVDEGSALGLAGVIADPGADTWTLTADFGDSSEPASVPVNPGGTFYVQHTFYDDRPSYQMILSATDDDGGTGNLSLTVNVTNVAPVVDVGGRAIAQRDVPFQRAGSFVDPGRETWTGWVDFGDGSGEQALNLSQDKSFLLEHIYSQNGQYAVTVRVADSHGAEDVAGFAVVVKDFVFSVDAGGDMQVNEGEAVHAAAQVSGPVDKMIALTVDYGDSSAKERLTLVPGAEGRPGTVSLNHTYADNGQFKVTIALIDSDGYTYEDSFTADVLNVAPDVKLSASSAEPLGGRLALSGSFTDPGDQKWTGTVDSGDGSAVKSLKLGADKTFSVNYTYKRPGVYAVKVTVRDDDGGEGFATCRVVVKSRESSDATLAYLQVADDTLIENSSDDTDFTTDCANEAPIVIAVTSNGHATLEYWDADGHWSPWPGNNVIQFSDEDLIMIRVTAENGRTLIYTIEHI